MKNNDQIKQEIASLTGVTETPMLGQAGVIGCVGTGAAKVDRQTAKKDRKEESR
jgi:hypothetical protein